MHPEQPTPTHPLRRGSWLRTFIGLPVVVGGLGVTLLLSGLRAAPLPVESLIDPTQIDDREGHPLSNWTFKGERSTFVPIQQIPIALQHATLAVEDANFYHHSAFSPTGILRALWVDVRHGQVEEGGSTITQQLARTLFLNQHRTIARKVKEALYSIQLEMHETKDTILAEYLNYVYYGYGAYGASEAAEVYFGKPLSHLSLAECAMLAGLPQAPSAYAPNLHFAAAKARQHTVLMRMVDAGFLTREAALTAYAAPIRIAVQAQGGDKAPYFTQVAVAEAKRDFGLTSEALYRGGIRVTTTVDPVLQQAAQRAISRILGSHKDLQAALVALDPNTGAIRAMVGGRDYETSPYNRVFAERQPGSTFKAVLYSAALQSGWTPASQVESVETTFQYANNKSYTVRDFGNEYANRPLTMRQAIARSDNVYAVTANLEVGPDQVIQTARTMGISTSLAPYPSLALGVFPVSPLQMAAAYATLANGGKRVTPYAISELSTPTGEVKQNNPAPVQVLSPQVAFQMSDLLRSVMEPHGTGYSVHKYLHQPVAAKTGTTDTDGWMVGYSPSTVCAVWVGYDDNRPISLSETHLASQIWAHFMSTAEQRSPYHWYKPAPNLVGRVLDPASGKLATDTCATTEMDYFVKGSEPTETCPLHPASHHPAPVPTHNRGLLHWLQGWMKRS